MSVPEARLDLQALAADPYPLLGALREAAPVVFCPDLGAYLVLRRDDIFREEKRTEVLSSVQPEGLMVRLMGQNMMRKDGAAHQADRRALFPAVSPRTVRDHWRARFEAAAEAVLDPLPASGSCDLVADVARPLAGAALVAMTGLAGLTPARMDAVSQAMIDGVANYAGLPGPEARARAAVAEIDAAIDAARRAGPDPLSVLGALDAAGMADADVRANVRLVISGGLNEPRDAIAGAMAAALMHPSGAGWEAIFDEYLRWMSPIGMSPRRAAVAASVAGAEVPEGARVFLMFGAGNRDPRAFAEPDAFRPGRDTSASLAFGAGPHFCAGAAAARVLVAEVALPRIAARLAGLRLAAPVAWHGWAFRGPSAVHVSWG